MKRYVSKSIFWTHMLKLISRAQISGNCIQDPDVSTTYYWSIHNDCESPFTTAFWSRPCSQLDGIKATDRKTARRYDLHISTRCRYCNSCLAARGKLWFARIATETAAAPRTWFGTLTLTSYNQQQFKLMAQHRCAIKNIQFEALQPQEQFLAVCKEISQELTKYIKRVRKSAAVPFRYVIVTEQHKSGDPHFHLLVHQVNKDEMLTYRMLSNPWKLGFTNFKLVENTSKASAYISKYVSKSMTTRMRSSIRYGNHQY